MRAARVHPLQILLALNTYAQGHGEKGKLTWKPRQRIVDALDGAFYLAFKAIEPTNARTLLALDVSGSMAGPPIAGMPGVTPRVGSAAMALVTAAVEPNHELVAFTNGTYRSAHPGFGSGISPIAISPRSRLDQVVRAVSGLPFGGTDCALPMLWAAENKVPVDIFCVYTDSETWAGDNHPVQALRAYRNKMGIGAKLVVIGMVSNGFAIADQSLVHHAVELGSKAPHRQAIGQAASPAATSVLSWSRAGSCRSYAMNAASSPTIAGMTATAMCPPAAVRMVVSPGSGWRQLPRCLTNTTNGARRLRQPRNVFCKWTRRPAVTFPPLPASCPRSVRTFGVEAAHACWAEEATMLQARTSESRSDQLSDKTVVRPFRVNVPEAELVELRSRINATRWPDRETVMDASQGVQLATIQKLACYWAVDYDWRACEARLNALPQFITKIDGLDIHFIHVRSKHQDALPMIVTHGWPGSIIEQLKIVDPLTNPTAYGARAEDAFDLVIPSLPGYGFSSKPTTTGWDPARIARAWVTLMKRLGYTRFVAQGGDWGAVITDVMAVGAPPELLAIHSNMPGTVPPEIARALQVGDPPPFGLSDEESRAYEQLEFVCKHVGYASLMSTRPQTLTGLADSPVGLAAFMIDHDARSYELIAQAFDRNPGGLTRDDVLDNITLTWVTNTALSSARLYWENTLNYFNAKNVSIPAAVSIFPDELYQAPRSWTERAYPRLIHYNTLPEGGHFAAWEQPQLFCEEIRASFRTLRQQ